jgi:hypothetical protein
MQLDPEAVDRTEHAGTHLNICAVLSLLGRHREAINSANKAVKVLGYKPPQKANQSLEADALEAIEGAGDRLNETQVGGGKTYHLMVAVAFYNLGIEHEHLSNVSEALIALSSSLDVCRRHLGKGCQMALKVEASRQQLL